jgi:ATP-binding cassette, subfamily B, bacterial PglK
MTSTRNRKGASDSGARRAAAGRPRRRGWTDIANIVGLLGPRTKRRLRRMAVVQAVTSLLDFAGVVLIGAAIATLTAESSGFAGGWLQPGRRFFESRGFDDPAAALTTSLAILAGIALLSKSVFSLLLNRRIARICAESVVEVATDLWHRRLSDPLLLLRNERSQKAAYELNHGVNSAILVGVTTLLASVGDVATLLLLVSVLFVASWTTALGLVVFFGLMVLFQMRALSRKVSQSALAQVENTLVASVFVQDSLGVYSELASSGSLGRVERQYREIRARSADSFARMVFLQAIPRYASEIAFVLGGALILIIQLSYRSLSESVGLLTVYLISSSRILPALLRLQNATLQVRSAAADAGGVFKLRNELSRRDTPTIGSDESDLAALDGTGLVIESLAFRYPEGGFSLQGLSATVQRGQSLALVGRSGSGKSTYANLIVGLLPPASGRVTLGGLSTRAALGTGRIRIGYVPQECYIIDATLRDNVTVGSADPIPDDVVIAALHRAHLGSLLASLPAGLDTQLGERGTSLSGGQRQRVAVARVLCGSVDLLVLDEATSALDAETETAISSALEEVMEHAAVVVIAHRLSTVRRSTVVAYLDNGSVRAIGTFDQVSQQVPEFARQAELLGIDTSLVDL